MTVMQDTSLSQQTTQPSYQAVDLTTLDAKTQAEVVSWVKSEYQKCKTARNRIEQQWQLNMAFFYGKQWAVIAQVPGMPNVQLATPQTPYWRARPVFNRIRPIIRTELAKVTSQKPSVSVIPASSDDEDLFRAQAAAQVWEGFYREKQVQRVIRSAMWWTLVTGTGFIKTWWDQNAIDAFSDQQGDICIKAESPFHVFVSDLREENIENQPYVIHATVKSMDYCNMVYKDQLKTPVSANIQGADDILNSAFLDLAGADTSRKDGVLCFEAWVKPGSLAKYPNGALLTVVGDQLVQAIEGWPYGHKQYPFIKLEHIPKGQFYTESTITDLISVQREYNRTHGQIIEAKNRMAKPQLIAPVGSINASQITTEPGQVIFYKPGFTPPQPLPLQPLPAYVLQELDRLNMEFDDISGQHEVSRGQTPTGVTAATAINFLQEQDDSKLSHTIDSLEMGMEKLGKQVLEYAVQFWDTERMIKITGKNESFDVLVLKGSELKGNTDLRVEAGSALPTSKAAKQAFLMDLMNSGFIDPHKGLELMEIGGINRLYEELNVDERQAQRENLRMQMTAPQVVAQFQQVQQSFSQFPMDAQGQPMDPNTGQPLMDPQTGQPLQMPDMPVPVNNFDDHGKHIDVHTRYQKSQAYDRLPEEIKQLFTAHVQAHVAALMQSSMPGGDPLASMNSSVPSDASAAASQGGYSSYSSTPFPPDASGPPNSQSTSGPNTQQGNPAAASGGQLP